MIMLQHPLNSFSIKRKQESLKVNSTDPWVFAANLGTKCSESNSPEAQVSSQDAKAKLLIAILDVILKLIVFFFLS